MTEVVDPQALPYPRHWEGDAVLADGTTGGLLASETALDRVAAALAGCGCR